MGFVNYGSREINFKVVYEGAEGAGKKSNFSQLHAIHSPASWRPVSELIQSSAETGETILSFTFSPKELASNGYRIVFSMQTITGKRKTALTSRDLLVGVDGIVFVLDSDLMRASDNIKSLQELIGNLAKYGKTINQIPLVLQYNKRDLTHAMKLEFMEKSFNLHKNPAFEAQAAAGLGVAATHVAIMELILRKAKSARLPV